MDPEQSMATCCPCEQPDIHGDGRWLAQHTNHLKRVTRSDPEIVFVGDTILYHLGLNSVWNKVFAPMHAVNFSIPGDGTQNLLWRIRDWVASPGHDSSGDVDQMKPKVFVVHVGTEMYTYNVEEVSFQIKKNPIIDSISKQNFGKNFGIDSCLSKWRLFPWIC